MTKKISQNDLKQCPQLILLVKFKAIMSHEILKFPHKKIQKNYYKVIKQRCFSNKIIAICFKNEKINIFFNKIEYLANLMKSW